VLIKLVLSVSTGVAGNDPGNHDAPGSTACAAETTTFGSTAGNDAEKNAPLTGAASGAA